MPGDGTVHNETFVKHVRSHFAEAESNGVIAGLFKVVRKFYPNCAFRKLGRKSGTPKDGSNSRATVITGLLKVPAARHLTLDDAVVLLTSLDWKVSSTTDRECQLSKQVNGNDSAFRLVLNDNQVGLHVGIAAVDLDVWGFPAGVVHALSDVHLMSLDTFLSRMKLCQGAPVGDRRLSLTKNMTLSSKDGVRLLRIKTCGLVPPLLSKVDCCRRCQKAVADCHKLKEGKKRSPDEESTLHETLQRVAPSLDERTLLTICQMVQNSQVDKKGRRWDREFITFALSLWTRSPKAYDDIIEGGYLLLPSVSQLRRYKNIVDQKPGVHDKVFQWMSNTATEKQLSLDGRDGGIIFDEMSLQPDLQIDTRGGQSRLVGLTEVDARTRDMDALLKQKPELQLGTHVLQFLFLGHTGFTFPFAHFPTAATKAFSLVNIFWASVSRLMDYGFSVSFCLFDGAAVNRAFMKLLFSPKPPLECDMTVPNIYDRSNDIVLGPDSKHVIKRLRNNVLTSGLGPNATRRLAWQDYDIVWHHWVQAFEWDRTNNIESARIHHKLTEEHVFLNPSSKMRNHLAEDCLSTDMLHLMQCFAESMSDATYLTGTLEFLKQTSKLIRIVSDDRMVKDYADDRLSQLLDIRLWFKSWADEVDASKRTNDEKKRMLMSAETQEDILFCCTSLMSIIKARLAKNLRAMPSRINSDVVENFFCQQRVICNGANTNPTYLQYCKGVNTIVLGRGCKSSSRKSNAGLKGALPFNFTAKESLEAAYGKRQKVTLPGKENRPPRDACCSD